MSDGRPLRDLPLAALCAVCAGRLPAGRGRSSAPPVCSERCQHVLAARLSAAREVEGISAR